MEEEGQYEEESVKVGEVKTSASAVSEPQPRASEFDAT